MRSRSVCAAIKGMFDSHDGDGNFILLPRGAPYVVIGPRSSTTHVLFCTKPQLLLPCFDAQKALSSAALVGRAGLPNEADMDWIASLVDKRQLLFVGDLDPVDLLIFAWLRTVIGGDSIRYAGICYATLGKVKAYDNSTLPLIGSEREAVASLNQFLPDVANLVGDECLQLIHNGRKIELEAVILPKGTQSSVIRELMRNRSSK